MATIYDVAAKAGVSAKTVSRVINGEPNVRSKTLDAVMAAIADLGYRPSTAARMMKSQRNNVIGFLTDRIVTRPETVDIARGVSETARELGQTVLFMTHSDTSAPLQGPEYNSLIDLNVDGLIYAAHINERVELAHTKLGCPTVLANCFSNDTHITSIIPDDMAGGFLAGQMLIDHGHKHVAMLNLDEKAFAASRRAKGFSQAFAKANLPKPIIRTALDERAGSWDEHECVPAVLDAILSMSPRPTALFCGNDKMAMVVYGLLTERGISVPNDISVVGFDDYPLITRLLRPQLSSVAIAFDEIGRRAVRELMAQIETNDQAAVHTTHQIEVPGTPAPRGSIKIIS